jgi:glycosyltransferase involved in cell wall biosynthesis
MAAILFLMRYPLDSWDNLKNKFDGQMAAAEALGHEAWHIGWSRSGMWLCRGQERTLLRKCPLAGMPGYSKTVLYIDLMAALRAAMEKKHFDAVYMRFMPVYGNAPAVLKAFRAQGGKLIVEHPTYPLEKGRVTSLLRKPVFWYTDRVFARLEPMIDLYTLIGDPCGETLHGRPAMNIVNGVNVDSLPLHTPRPEGAEICLLALASMSYWQGYDRLIRALAAYRGPERIRILMVGGEGDGSLAAWKKLAEELGVADRVSFLGEMFGEQLDEVVRQCDIGIGGLGLHRIGQYQSTTLKLREYMARGLPFVYAVEDASIPAEAGFCRMLPNDDSPLSMEQLAAFALESRRDETLPARMRAYAKAHMSWEGVLRAVLARVGIG